MSIPTEPGYYWLKGGPLHRWQITVVSETSIFPLDGVGYWRDDFSHIFPHAQWGPRIEPPKEEK